MNKNSKLTKFVVVSASALMMLSLGAGVTSIHANAASYHLNSDGVPTNVHMVKSVSSKAEQKKDAATDAWSNRVRRQSDIQRDIDGGMSRKQAINSENKDESMANGASHKIKHKHQLSHKKRARKNNNKVRRYVKKIDRNAHRSYRTKAYKSGESLGKLVSGATNASSRYIYKGLNYRLPKASRRYQKALDKGFLKNARKGFYRELAFGAYTVPRKKAAKESLKYAKVSLNARKNYQKHSSSYAFRLGAHAELVSSYRPSSLKRYLHNKSFINGWKTALTYANGNSKRVNYYYHHFSTDISHNMKY